MKRRTSRRQVLNLNDNQDSPGHTWQTKYQQICAEHLSHHNRNTASKMSAQNIPSGNSQNSNPLTDLVGQYNSDSESEDESKDLSSNKIDAKVSDFLKEIHEIDNASAETNNESALPTVTVLPTENSDSKPQPPPPPSAAMIAAAAAAYQTTDGQNQVQHPGMLWQECYDESSGYVYYWNMETNAVTWEMPPEYHAYVSASYDAQQWMYHQQAMYQHSMQQMDMSSYNMMAGYGYIGANNEDNILTEENNKSIVKKPKGKHKKKKRTGDDDNDEEIEMITSYGPVTDDESDEIEEEKQHKVLKKKKILKKARHLNSKGDVHGPRNELHSNFEVADDDPSDFHSFPMPSFSNNVDDSVPPGMENIDEEIVYKNQVLSKHSNKNNASDSDILKLKDSECNGDVKHEGNVANERLGVGSPSVDVNTPENEDDNTETDESLILSKLRNRAKVLKELGGDIPDEIKNLIDSSSDDVISSVNNSHTEQQVIDKSVEKVLKLDETNDLNLIKTEEVGSEENSPKTTPFALIANYGDDSDTEEKLNKESRPKKGKIHKEKKLQVSDPEEVSSTIFPITEFIKPEKHISNNTANHTENKSNVEKLIISEKNKDPKITTTDLSLEKCLLIQSENNLSADEKRSLDENLHDGVSELNLIDLSSNNRAFKRKKRLEIGDSVSPADGKPSIVPVSSDNSSVTSGGTTTYTTFTNYNLDPSSNERRGFGFQNASTGDSLNLLGAEQSTREEKSKIGKRQKRGMINFVKAETINLQNEAGKKKGAEETEETLVKELNTKEDIQDLAESIMEKLKFLSEGENPISSVLAMAIQVETLTSAWHSGALIQTYFTNWLNEKGEDLNQLEQCAAPYGWACQWDRTYKRYYYVNLDTGETQWEYPDVPLEEDCNAEGEEMELCTTPPPPPSVDEAVLQPNEPPIPTEEPPKTPPPPPPPPHISVSIPSPPRPPRISEAAEKSPLPKKKRKLSNAHDNKNTDMTLCSDNLPPLPPSSPPPLPPPPDDPPPLPPSPPSQAPSPPKTSLSSQTTVRGEPLPPGVDAPELPYIVSGPPPPPPPAPSMETYQLPLHTVSESVEYDATAIAYADAQHYIPDGSYQHMGLTSIGLEYGPMAYMPAVNSSHTIERPATKNKASLFDELDSFYSDLATLESAGVISPPAISEPEPEVTDTVKEEETIMNVQELQGSQSENQTPVESEGETQNKSSETTFDVRKRKKTKLVPALGLKKKGVSTLVAKWQQVQQEARRDYKNLDEDDDSSN